VSRVWSRQKEREDSRVTRKIHLFH